MNIAEGATSSLKDILIRMRELATQSSNGTLKDTQRQALDGENQALIGEYNRILQTTDFNGRKLFDSNKPRGRHPSRLRQFGNHYHLPWHNYRGHHR